MPNQLKKLVDVKWKKGKGFHGIVSDTPVFGGLGNDSENVESYGGHLVCESVATKYNAMIVNAPAVLAILNEIVAMVNDGKNIDLGTIITAEKAISASL